MAIKTFTTGEVLTASDTNTYLANSGLVYVTSATIGTAVSSVTVSNCFSATYDHYKIIVSGGTASTRNNITFQLSGITTSVYDQLGYFQQWGLSTINAYAANATTIIGYEGSTNSSIGDIEIKNPFLTIRKFGVINQQSTHGQYSMPFYINSTASATGFTFTTGSGTLTGGTITVYGYRKA